MPIGPGPPGPIGPGPPLIGPGPGPKPPPPIGGPSGGPPMGPGPNGPPGGGPIPIIWSNWGALGGVLCSIVTANSGSTILKMDVNQN